MYIKWVGIPLGLIAHKACPQIDWRLSILIAFTLTYALDALVERIYYSRKAHKLGCLPPPVRPHKLPFGIDMLRIAIEADKNHTILEVFNEIFIQTRSGSNATYEQRLFANPTIFTADPKNVQAILATQFNDFELGKGRTDSFHALLGVGIFTANGKTWEHSRALLRPQFSRDQVGDLELEEFHVQSMFKHLHVNADGWTDSLNLAPVFFRLTFDSATEFLFGQSVDSQRAALSSNVPENQLPEKTVGVDWRTVSKSFDEAMHDLGHRARYNNLWWIHSPKSFYEHCKEVHKFADYYVQLALNTDLYANKEISHTGKKPKYIFLAELVKSTRNPRELRDQLLNILLAGRDTTAGLLGWTFWLLARHPHVFQKLRKTILDDFGTYHDPHDITFATLKGCQYLQYTMNEVLRLYPSVPLNSRSATRDTTIPRGGGPDGLSPIFVRKGQEVNYSVFIMQRRFDLWGPDAEEFVPERWVGRKTGWDYLPFNGGPRVCLGQQFALTEAGYVIVRMLQRYDRIENLDPSNVPKHQYSVTTAPLSLDLRLHEAD